MRITLHWVFFRRTHYSRAFHRSHNWNDFISLHRLERIICQITILGCSRLSIESLFHLCHFQFCFGNTWLHSFQHLRTVLLSNRLRVRPHADISHDACSYKSRYGRSIINCLFVPGINCSENQRTDNEWRCITEIIPRQHGSLVLNVNRSLSLIPSQHDLQW